MINRRLRIYTVGSTRICASGGRCIRCESPMRRQELYSSQRSSRLGWLKHGCPDLSTGSSHCWARIRNALRPLSDERARARFRGHRVTDGPGVRQVTRRELLDIREQQWALRLRRVSLAAEAEFPGRTRAQVASALGYLYGKGRHAGSSGIAFLISGPPALSPR